MFLSHSSLDEHLIHYGRPREVFYTRKEESVERDLGSMQSRQVLLGREVGQWVEVVESGDEDEDEDVGEDTDDEREEGLGLSINDPRSGSLLPRSEESEDEGFHQKCFSLFFALHAQLPALSTPPGRSPLPSSVLVAMDQPLPVFTAPVVKPAKSLPITSKLPV